MLGKFITIEGPDGSGKTSAIQALGQRLAAMGYDQDRLLLTREPGGSQIAEQIRQVILDVDNKAMDARTEALLYAAARRQHMVESLIPSLQAGKLVISDRFVDSSMAYQGVARNLPLDWIWKINQFAIEDYLPDLTLLLDVPADLGLRRIYQAQGQRQFDRLDQEDLSFHQLVRQAFLDLAAQDSRIQLIDASQPLDQVVEEMFDCLVKNKIIEEPEG